MSTRFSRLSSTLVLSAALLIPAVATATPLVSITNVTGQTLGNPPFTLGWAFTANANLLVTDLGLFDSSQNGLGEAHAIGLWDSGGALLGSTTVAAGTVDPLISQFRYASVAPILLTAGQTYQVGAVFASGLDPLIFPGNATGFSTLSAITFLESRFAAGGTLLNPTFTAGPDAAYFGTNINANIIPEPTTLVLLGSGVLFALVRRRRV